MSNLDHKSNLITTTALLIGGLSITDKITFIIGVIALALAGISNYYAMKKNKVSLENERLENERLKKLLGDEK